MPQGSFADAKQTLDLHGYLEVLVPTFFSRLFHTLQKRCVYSETGILFLALSSHEGMFCSGRSCKE